MSSPSFLSSALSSPVLWPQPARCLTPLNLQESAFREVARRFHYCGRSRARMQVASNEGISLGIRKRIEELGLEKHFEYGDSEWQNLWQAIQECASQLSDSQTHLSLHPAISAERNLNLCKFYGSLLVRQCYKDARDCIEAAGAEGRLKDFLILGSPGIGKSYFLLYMLVYLSRKRQKQTVIYFNTVHEYRYMLCVGTDIVLEIPNFDSYMKLLRTWHDDHINYYQLYDAGTKGFKTDPIVPLPHLVTIVASSPDKSNYMQFAKCNPQELYMEPWSYKELRKGNQLLNHPIDEPMLRKRYALAGGIPRWVLDPSFDIEFEICFAVRNAAGEDVRKAWKDANSGMSAATDSGISNEICHIVPTKDRRRYSPIPAGMFAAYHIQAMTEMSDNEDYRALFETLGMSKDESKVGQGAVKFDWETVREGRVEDVIESWWSAIEAEFTDRCREFEETHFASRMRQG